MSFRIQYRTKPERLEQATIPFFRVPEWRIWKGRRYRYEWERNQVLESLVYFSARPEHNLATLEHWFEFRAEEKP